MSPRRDPTEVIDRIVEQLPEGYDALRADLARCRTDAFFKPPEHMGVVWARIGQALESALHNPPEHPWELNIMNIIQGRE